MMKLNTIVEEMYELEVHPDSHLDKAEDYPSLTDFYLSGVIAPMFIAWVEGYYNISREDAIWVQQQVINKIKEGTDGK